MRLGVLDVGSNTVHLQIMDAHHGSAPIPYQSFKEDIRLAEFLTADGDISEEGIRTLVDGLSQLKKEAKEIQLDDMLSFATSAIREARNSEQVLSKVREETGIDLQVLSGKDEARFTFLAARRWVGWSAGDVLLLDIGGGSLEIATGKGENPDYSHSVMLGANRLTRTYLNGDPFTDKSLAQLRETIAETLKPLVNEIGDNSERSAIGTSKTFRTLRRIQQNYLPEYGNSLTSEGLKIIVPKLSKMTIKERAGLPGVSATRAVQIAAGAMVADAALDLFGIKKITQCPWALREGILLQRLDWLKS